MAAAYREAHERSSVVVFLEDFLGEGAGRSTTLSSAEKRTEKMATFVGSAIMNRHKVFGMESPPNFQKALEEKGAQDRRDSGHDVENS